MILNSISGPRNISTAFMYAFAQRPDTIVLDEPFYGVYLAKTGVDHPGKTEVLASQPTREEDVIREIGSRNEKPLLFIKNMAHHIEVTNQDYLRRSSNIFLIRDPARIISSYSRVIEKPSMRDIGISFQYSLFSSLWQDGYRPAVIDTALLLEDPEAVLKKLCDLVNIPWHPEMLRWKKGPKPYDGVWAKYWYNNVHQSEGFSKPKPDDPFVLPEELIPLYEEAKAIYQKFLAFTIHP